MKVHLLLLINLLMLCLSWPLPAQAQDRTVYADYLFQEGVRLMHEDRCPEAIPKFKTSHQLDPSAASLVNLGTCYTRVGQSATAWRTFRKAAELAAKEHDDALKEQAFKAISLLTPKLTNLRIVTTPGAPPPKLTLNGEPLTLEEGTDVIPLDPGENVIEATAPGREPWRRSVSSGEVGATIIIEVPDLTPREEPPRISRTWRTASIITTGVGVSGIVAGLALGLSANATYEESENGCNTVYCDPGGYQLRTDAIHRANVATVVVGMGALVATTGVVLMLVAPKQAKPSIGLSPFVPATSTALGLSASGRL